MKQQLQHKYHHHLANFINVLKTNKLTVNAHNTINENNQFFTSVSEID